MIASLSTETSRLCGACGMCCDGVMFYSVNLQPEDSVRELKSLGIRIKRKKDCHSILQPCSAYRNCACSIYAQRPQRCRLFDCQQLRKVISGEMTEAAALEKIQQARQQANIVLNLLMKAGSTNLKRSLTTRYEAALSQAIDIASNPAAAAIREQLIQAFEKLEEMLAKDFRVSI